ncbi:MAG: ABC transporter substrate-binding protein [Chloroflexi bacterium]|nr:ABC transporter substrate-binding protein [Chloroflexota bacterium]
MSDRTYWYRLRHRKISRRTMLGASAKAGVGAAGLALVGCGGDDDDDDAAAPAAAAAPAEEQAQAEEQAMDEDEAEEQAEAEAAAADEDEEMEEEAAPMAGEVDFEAELIVGYGSFPPTLDVMTAAGQGGQGASNNNHFNQAFAYNTGRVLQPSGGFGNYEFTDDNFNFRITLEPGVTFHNGEPLNAEALAFYYERTRNNADYDQTIEGANAARIGWMGDIKVVDDLTLDIGMAGDPAIDAPEQSGGINFNICPKQYIIENGDEHFANNPVGHGQYQFESWIPDQEIRSTRFENYHFPRDAEFQHKAGWVKKLTGRYFPEEQARAAALEAGEVDIAYRIGSDVAGQFEDTDDFQVIVLPDVRVMSIELPINQSLDPITGEENPWRDVRVRKAANYAIDAQSIVDNLLTGNEERAYSPFPAGYPLPIGNMDGPYTYDPDRARALLEEAGQVGFAFKITLPTGLWTGDRVWMPAVQQMLNDVGFQVEVDYADFGNALAEIRNHELPNPFIFNQGSTRAGAPLGPAFAYALITTIGSPYSHANPTDDFLPEFLEFQRLIDEAGAEFDATRRADMYFEAATIHYENAFVVPLFNLSHLYATRNNIRYTEYYDTSTGFNPVFAQVLST